MSAAKRVAHAAETVRARWERQVSTDPQTEAAQALEDAGQLLDPEVAAELAAFRKGRELAEVVAREGALPVPVGPVPRTLGVVEEELTGANLSLWEEEQANRRLRLALESAKRGRRELRSALRFSEPSRERWRAAAIEAEEKLGALKARVAELEAECHTTNEALDDAVQEPRARQSCLCPPADQPGPHQVGCPLAEVPVAEAATRLIPTVGWLREDPHDSPLHQTHRLPRDLPDVPSLPVPPSCGLSADELDEISRDVWFGGGGS